MGTENTRKHIRVDLRKDVLINGSIKARGLDLSLGGLYVHTGRQFKSGSVVNLTLPLNNELINLRARVQRSEAGVGMGLSFLNTSDDTLDSINLFILRTERKNAAAGKKTVMLVEGDQNARRMKKSRLVLDGFDVIEAVDGESALALLGKKNVDAIVLDLGLDGFRVLSLLGQNPAWKTIPVLVVSARSSAADLEKAVNAGAKALLPKMMTSPAKLSERIKQCLAGGTH